MPAPLANVTAVILAGGFGTRIRHLFPDLPKPMIPVCGRPFVEWVARYLQRQGVGEIIFSTGHLGEIIENHFAKNPVAGLRVQSVRETEPLGTAGGFLNAIAGQKKPPAAWLVLNGDSMVFADLKAAAEPLARSDVDGAVVGVNMADASRYGRIVFDASNRLVRFQEKIPGAGVINAGIYFFKPALAAKFPATLPLSFEKDVFPELLAAGANLAVTASDAPFLDIGTPESVVQAEEFIRQNQHHL